MKLNDEQQLALEEMKKSEGWLIVLKLAKNILEETRLDTVDTKLSDTEYKGECLARTKAKSIISKIFNNIDNIEKDIIKSKIDYS